MKYISERPTPRTGFDVNCVETSIRKQVGGTATFSCEFNLYDGKPRANELLVMRSMVNVSILEHHRMD